jgi:hypothetical protein
MKQAEMDELILELISYARALIARKRWLPRGELPHGYEAGALAVEAITRVVDGRRKWNPTAEPDLLPYLKSVVKSILWELKPAARREEVEVAPVGKDGIDLTAEARTEDPGPLELLELGEETASGERFKDQILSGFEEDEDKLVLMSIFEGRGKAAEIAADLGLPVEDVYRIKRKIKRRLERLGYGA